MTIDESILKIMEMIERCSLSKDMRIELLNHHLELERIRANSNPLITHKMVDETKVETWECFSCNDWRFDEEVDNGVTIRVCRNCGVGKVIE